MQKDLHMSDVEWSAGISLFYGMSRLSCSTRPLTRLADRLASCSYTVGYIITQLPGSLILSRFKPRIIMPAMM